MRALVVLIVVVVVGCASRQPVTPKETSGEPSPIVKAAFNAALAECRRKYADTAPEMEYCLLSTGKQKLEALYGPPGRNTLRSTTCTPDFLGGFSCTEY